MNPTSGEPTGCRSCRRAVVELGREMAAGRRQRLVRLGFDPDHAARLAELHTRNFM